MSTFTDVYKKARDVTQAQKFAEPEWEKFLADTCGLKMLFGPNGFDTEGGSPPESAGESRRSGEGR